MKGFSTRNCAGFSYIALCRWEEIGLFHGFSGKLAFSELETRVAAARCLGASEFYFLDQVHGSDVLDLREEGEFLAFKTIAERGVPYPLHFRADAVLLRRLDKAKGVGVALRTADCVPIIVLCEDQLALIHAGWRGLAGGIISKTIAMMSRTQKDNFEAAIGPCAGGERYEVKRDVLNALVPSAVYTPAGEGRYKLYLAQTAINQLRQVCGERLLVWESGICTISNPDYHSFRREGNRSGRNLSFVIV